MTDLAETFCKTLPHMPLIWDPTRLAPAVACLRKHYYQTYRGLRLNGGTSVHLEWGRVYHKCTQIFDEAIEQGVPREEATLETMWHAFDLSWDHERDQPKWGQYIDLFQCTDPEYRPSRSPRDHGALVLNRERCQYAKKAWEDIPLGVSMAMNVHICRNCGHRIESIRKWFPLHPKKTRGNLLRAVALYCDTPGLVPYSFADKSPTTEVQHTVPLPIVSPDWEIRESERNGARYQAPVHYKLLVNIDSIPEFDDVPAIRERKTTGLSKLDWRFWQQYEMSPQTDTYDLVGNVIYAEDDLPVKMLIEATRVSQSGETEIQRAPIHISDGRRAEWFAELQEVIQDVERRTVSATIAEGADLDPTVHFPRRTTACITKNGTCAFWRLCTADPGDRETIIAADYHVEHWNPVTATSTMEDEE